MSSFWSLRTSESVKGCRTTRCNATAPNFDAAKSKSTWQRVVFQAQTSSWGRPVVIPIVATQSLWLGEAPPLLHPPVEGCLNRLDPHLRRSAAVPRCIARDCRYDRISQLPELRGSADERRQLGGRRGGRWSAQVSGRCRWKSTSRRLGGWHEPGAGCSRPGAAAGGAAAGDKSHCRTPRQPL